MSELKLPNCPACGSKAIRHDMKNVEAIVRCTECSLSGFITDWEMITEPTQNDGQWGTEALKQINEKLDSITLPELTELFEEAGKRRGINIAIKLEELKDE